MIVNEQDIELLEMYLDHELSDPEARSLDERLAGDAQLQKALDRLRSHRQLRLTAMSSSFDTDAAAVERLVASVRTAQFAEETEQAESAMSKASAALALKRRATSPVRSIFAAAACVAFGLLLGVAIQRQQAPNGLVATPSVGSVSSFTNVGLEPHGAYVVSLVNNEGREVMKVRFPTPEHARQFMDSINNRSAPNRTLNVNNATILEEPY